MEEWEEVIIHPVVNVSLQIGIDTFARDIYALVSFIWPVGISYNNTIFNLQIEHNFIFYLISLIMLTGLLFVLVKLITSRLTLLIFSFLWIFITLMPAHNLMIPSWQFQPRYFYLPSVAFCIFISIIIYRIIQNKKGFNLSKISIMAFIFSVLSICSLLIIRENRKVAEDGELMHRFISDMKQYHSEMADSTNFYFINFPSSSLNTISNVYLYDYLNDLFRYTDDSKGYSMKRYNHEILLYTKNHDRKRFKYKMVEKNDFIVDGIQPDNYFLIPDTPSLRDNQIKKIYKTMPHYLAEPLTSRNRRK